MTDDKSTPLVLFGAGRNSVDALETVNEHGWSAVCFCDSAIEKQGTVCCGLPVLSLEEAKKRFGTFRIFVTPSVPLKYEIQQILLRHGIDRTSIVNFDAVSYYKSCYFIESAMVINRNEMFPCCFLGDLRPQSPSKVRMTGSMEESVKAFMEYRDKLIADHRNGVDTCCQGCSELKADWYFDDKKIKSLAYGGLWPCQLRCAYCDIHKLVGADLREEIEFVKSFDYSDMIQCLASKGCLDDDAHIEFSAGEIALNPHKDRIFSTIMRDYPAILFSNCVVYDEKIAKITAKPDSFLVLSLDCGTRETYSRIKHSDAFDTVAENLRRYSGAGANIHLKYVIIPGNCEKDADLRGFIDLAKENRVGSIRISCDLNDNHAIVEPKIIDFAVNLGKAAVEEGFETLILPHFGDANTRFITESVFPPSGESSGKDV